MPQISIFKRNLQPTAHSWRGPRSTYSLAPTAYSPEPSARGAAASPSPRAGKREMESGAVRISFESRAPISLHLPASRACADTWRSVTAGCRLKAVDCGSDASFCILAPIALTPIPNPAARAPKCALRSPRAKGAISEAYSRHPTPSLSRSTLHAPRASPRAAFTLLEVMLVIGIIAILAVLLYPVVIGSSEKARIKQAEAETRTILTAIKAFRHEYNRWPGQHQAAKDTTYFTNNWIVIQALLGSNVTHPVSGRRENPRGKVFLDLPITTNNPDSKGNYLDPWGLPYFICMDENEDGRISIPTNRVNDPWVYMADDRDGRRIGPTNIVFTSQQGTNVDVGVGSLGNTSNRLEINTWQTIL